MTGSSEQQDLARSEALDIHLQHGRGKKREETTKMAKILNRDAFTPAFKTIDWSHIFLFRLLH